MALYNNKHRAKLADWQLAGYSTYLNLKVNTQLENTTKADKQGKKITSMVFKPEFQAKLLITQH